MRMKMIKTKKNKQTCDKKQIKNIQKHMQNDKKIMIRQIAPENYRVSIYTFFLQQKGNIK
jgi:hypothetical protein